MVEVTKIYEGSNSLTSYISKSTELKRESMEEAIDTIKFVYSSDRYNLINKVILSDKVKVFKFESLESEYESQTTIIVVEL